MISLIETLFSIFFCFHVISKKLRKWSFLPLKSNNSYKESSNHLDPMETSVELLVPRTMTPVGKTERYLVLNQPLLFMPQTTNFESIKQRIIWLANRQNWKSIRNHVQRSTRIGAIDATCRILHSAIDRQAYCNSEKYIILKFNSIKEKNTLY
jgi:hypothetical protein